MGLVAKAEINPDLDFIMNEWIDLTILNWVSL